MRYFATIMLVEAVYLFLWFLAGRRGSLVIAYLAYGALIGFSAMLIQLMLQARYEFGGFSGMSMVVIYAFVMARTPLFRRILGH